MFKNILKKFKQTPSVGHLDKVKNNTLYGWYYNPSQPNEPQNLTVIINGSEKYQFHTGLFRKDLLENGFSNGNHGFAYEVRKNLSPSDHIRVIADNEFELLNSEGFTRSHKVKDTSSIFGRIITTRGGVVEGWFIDKNDKNRIFELPLEIDGSKEVLVKNDKSNEGFAKKYNNTESGGFEVDLSSYLSDGDRHMICLRDKFKGDIIDKTFFKSRIVHIESEILKADSNQIIGWCKNKLIPQNRLKIELYIDKDILQIISACEDISNEFPNVKGDYGFKIDLSNIEENANLSLMAASEKVIYRNNQIFSNAK